MVSTKETREKERSARDNLSKFFYDLAKTTFASTVVGDVVSMFLKEEVTISAVELFVVGLVTTALLAIFGYRISKNKVMEALIITLAGTGVIALILNIWLGTKSGQKWLKSL